MEETEKFTFVVQKIDFWNILISDSSWALIGIVGYFLIAYRDVIFKNNLISIMWKHKGLIGYSFTLTTLAAIVNQSFPFVSKFVDTLPYPDILGIMGFVGVGAAAMRFTNGENKKQLKKDLFIKKTGIDPDAIIVEK